jgi:hypothetical protein
MDHAPARGVVVRRPHWWVGIGGRLPIIDLARVGTGCGQRKRR